MVRRAAGYALVVLVTLLQAGAVTTGSREQPEPPLVGSAAVTLGLLQGALLFVLRRGGGRSRGPVAAVICGLYVVQAGLAGAVLPAAPWVALAWLVVGRVSRAWIVAGLGLLGAGLTLGSFVRPASQGAVPLLAALTAVILLSVAVRVAWRARAEALRARAAEASRRAASQERLALARELHDSIGHGLSAVAVQSSAARMALQAGDGETAARSLAAAEASSRAALREMRDLVAVLRDPDGAIAPTAGLADLDGVLRRTREAGIAASLEVSPDVESLPSGTQATVYRIVQEGLTNVVRHAPGAWARVRVSRDGESLLVDVENGGARGAPSGVDREGPGYGLAGLRERVQLVGGTLQAGAATSGAGWRLTARLPLTPQEGRT